MIILPPNNRPFNPQVDCIIGQGRRFRDYPGNRCFRNCVAAVLRNYQKASRDAEQFRRGIVQVFQQSAPGRYFYYAANNHNDNNSDRPLFHPVTRPRQVEDWVETMFDWMVFYSGSEPPLPPRTGRAQQQQQQKSQPKILPLSFRTVRPKITAPSVPPHRRDDLVLNTTTTTTTTTTAVGTTGIGTATTKPNDYRNSSIAKRKETPLNTTTEGGANSEQTAKKPRTDDNPHDPAVDNDNVTSAEDPKVASNHSRQTKSPTANSPVAPTTTIAAVTATTAKTTTTAQPTLDDQGGHETSPCTVRFEITFASTRFKPNLVFLPTGEKLELKTTALNPLK
eukprot:scaffold2329_cov161-Amphora_coffeaeformis.AAC.1